MISVHVQIMAQYFNTYYITYQLKAEKVRPLTSDQKLQNALYLRVLKARWEVAKTNLEKEIAEVLAERKPEDVQADNGEGAEEKRTNEGG